MIPFWYFVFSMTTFFQLATNITKGYTKILIMVDIYLITDQMPNRW